MASLWLDVYKSNVNLNVVTASGSVSGWQAILTLVLFVLSNVAVILPLCIPIPQIVLRKAYIALVNLKIAPYRTGPFRTRHICFDFISVPLISVLLLLAIGVFDGNTVRDGIAGTGGIRPLNIMALFISLAYLTISLDATGLFRFLAFWVASKGGSSGRRLFVYLYVFFLVCGILVGNDPVVLSGTPFLAYFTNVAGITPPTAWIFTQFAAANMAAVVLVSSNLTNLVLSGAFSISFLSYAANVVLPFLAAAVLILPLLLYLFRSHTLIPPRLDIGLSGQEVRETLLDKRGAILGSTLLLVALGVLVGVSTIKVPVWEVTVPPAVIMLLRDLHHDWSSYRAKKSECDVIEVQETVPADDPPPRVEADTAVQDGQEQYELDEVCSCVLSISASQNPCGPPSHSARPPSTSGRSTPSDLWTLLQTLLGNATKIFPTVTRIAERLPIALLPFVFLMSILVQGLSTQGWVEVLAHGWAAWISKTGTLGAVGGMGLVSCLLCNLCGTNIGATILLARVLQLWSASDANIDARTRDGAIYALALGSNFGAFSLTISASLAGLLWREILRQKGIRVRPRQFLLLNLPISLVAMSTSCAVLVAQVYVKYR